MQFLVLFRRKWPLTLLYRPPFIQNLKHRPFLVIIFSFPFSFSIFLFILLSLLFTPFFLFPFFYSHIQKKTKYIKEKRLFIALHHHLCGSVASSERGCGLSRTGSGRRVGGGKHPSVPSRVSTAPCLWWKASTHCWTFRITGCPIDRQG